MPISLQLVRIFLFVKCDVAFAPIVPFNYTLNKLTNLNNNKKKVIGIDDSKARNDFVKLSMDKGKCKIK